MRFSPSDGLVTGLAGVLSGLLLYIFFLDLNAIAGHGTEPSLGTIVFRKQTATRKSTDSQVWERLQNHSAVYQSDTLRTSDGSEAVLNFEDGLSLDMLANTMLKLTMKGRARNVDFAEGSIALHGGGTSGPVSLGQTGRTLTLSPDAQLVVNRKTDNLSLELSQGTASISDGQGHEQAFSPTQAVELDTATGAARLRAVEMIPQSPLQGARLLNLAEGPIPVAFTFQLAGSKQTGAEVQLQLSGQADFSTISSQVAARAGVRVPLEPGTWYWRLTAGKDSYSSVRQFSLAHETPLSLSEPLDGVPVAYRKKLPALRFSWTADEFTVSSTLELAFGSPDFRNPLIRRRTNLTSLVLDELKAGTWYWRVVPEYGATVVSAAITPPVRSFTVVRRAEMAQIAPLVPVEGTLFQTQELATKGIALTWDPVPEAKSYELTAYRGRATGNPTAHFTVTSPYVLLEPRDLGPLTQEGDSVWVLQWVDDEGNRSPTGPARNLHAVDGSLALRPTYPPDGYKVAGQFLTNTRFSWKSNLRARTDFQVSTTRDFAELAFSGPAEDGTRLGKDWGKGLLYWRLSSYNTNGSVFLQTPPRSFEVVDPFPAVQLTDPAPGSTILLPEHETYGLSWLVTKGADFYQLKVFSAGENATPAKQIFQTEVETPAGQPSGSVKIPLGDWPDGRYLARLQAFGRETLLSTSIIGLYGETQFSFRHLAFPDLTSPAEGEKIDGLAALRRGVNFHWETANPPPDTVVEVRREGSLVVQTASVGDLHVARFPAGEYTWTVTGHIDRFDLTAKAPNHFTVTEIPKFPPPRNLSPVNRMVFGPAQLRTLKDFELSWSAVEGAHEYRVRLFREGGLLPVYDERIQVEHVTLDKAKLLDRGTFTWEVEALSVGPDGSVEQEGIAALQTFTVDVPVVSAPKLPTGRTFYGR